jgi:hypothetical protein
VPNTFLSSFDTFHFLLTIPAGFAMLVTPFVLALEHFALLNHIGFAPNISDTFGPAELAHIFIAVRVVYQIVKSGCRV